MAFRVLAVQGHSGLSKVNDLIESAYVTTDFLLVLHCDYGPLVLSCTVSEIRRLIG